MAYFGVLGDKLWQDVHQGNKLEVVMAAKVVDPCKNPFQCELTGGLQEL